MGFMDCSPVALTCWWPLRRNFSSDLCSIVYLLRPHSTFSPRAFNTISHGVQMSLKALDAADTNNRFGQSSQHLHTLEPRKGSHRYHKHCSRLSARCLTIFTCAYPNRVIVPTSKERFWPEVNTTDSPFDADTRRSRPARKKEATADDSKATKQVNERSLYYFATTLHCQHYRGLAFRIGLLYLSLVFFFHVAIFKHTMDRQSNK